MAVLKGDKPVFLVSKILVLLTVICTAQGVAGYVHETGEEKSMSYSHSQESGQASHRTYSRVSGTGEVPPALPHGSQAGTASAVDIERGSSALNAAHTGLGSDTAGSQSSGYSVHSSSGSSGDRLGEDAMAKLGARDSQSRAGSSYTFRSSSSSSGGHGDESRASFGAESSQSQTGSDSVSEQEKARMSAASSQSHVDSRSQGDRAHSQHVSATDRRMHSADTGFRHQASSSSSSSSLQQSASGSHSSHSSGSSDGAQASGSRSSHSSGSSDEAQASGSRSSHSSGSSDGAQASESYSRSQAEQRLQAAREAQAARHAQEVARRRAETQQSRRSQTRSSTSGRTSGDSRRSGQSTSSRELLTRRCQDCTVNGTQYRGHSRFQYEDGCRRFRCVCNCDGSYTCPPKYALDICKDKPRVGTRDQQRPTSAPQRRTSAPQRRTSAPQRRTSAPQRGTSAQQRPTTTARPRTRQQQQQRRRRCQTCKAHGQEFKGNAYFEVQDGCTKYRGCVCYCNGTWTCPSERAVNTCKQTTPTPRVSTCGACNAEGKVVAGNSYFELEVPCRRYRNCFCLCNGTWTCPPQAAEDTCKSPSAWEDDNPGCQNCTAKGKVVRGNSYFDLKDGCTEYRNCVCRCNGSWNCPSQHARNTCAGQGSDGAGVTSRVQGATAGLRGQGQAGVGRLYIGQKNGEPVYSRECQPCYAFNSYFRGNTYFTARQGCRQYDRCVCRCDGSWDCPARYATDLCRDNDPGNDVANTNDTCFDCDALGKIVHSNTYFNMTEGCTQYQRCLCHCDGEWACPESSARNICEGPKTNGDRPEVCGNCVVNNRVVRGNNRFDLVSDCFRYRGCLCRCDGSYECKESRAENICGYDTTGSASSSSTPTTARAVTSRPQPACVRCFAYGQFHAPNTRFVHDEGCLEYECDCHCNGSHTCPRDRTRNTCQTGCSECEVDGQFFEGNTYFKRSRGCVEHLCTCFCNGSYACPADRANNTCATGTKDDIDSRSTVTDVGRQRQGRCSQCVTNDGSRYQPDTDFELQEGCIHYQCRCNCDGSWNCPGESARNVCRGEVLGGCRSCVISERQIYRGNEPFQMRQGCVHYQCTCNCDGSWECPGAQARDICLGEVPGGCRVCRVSTNETYRGDTAFQLRQGCNHYQCRCHCNGSWECPGHTARDVCIGEVPGGCRVCKLDGGQVHRGESEFQLVKDCIHYTRCRCRCDGSWSCPGHSARRVCNADGSPLGPTAPPTTTTTAPPPARAACRQCLVSDAEHFMPDRFFTLRRGCQEFSCECKCDGSWSCPNDRTRDVCSREATPQLRAQSCTSCRVAADLYPGRSSFLLTRGCAQYACTCDCSGRWSCNHTVVRNVCQEDGGEGRRGAVPRHQVSASSPRRVNSVSSGPRRSSAASFSSVSAGSTSSSRVQQSGLTSSQRVDTAKGSTVAEVNLQSVRTVSRPAAGCTPCTADGRQLQPQRPFVIERKCKQFNCFCSCNGRWRCPRERTVDLCPGGAASAAAAAAAAATSSGGSSIAWRGSRVSTSSSSGSGGQGGAEQSRHTGARRFGTTNIRVVGADTAADSSSSSSSSFSSSGSSSSVSQESGGHAGHNVRGYYVDSSRTGGGMRDGTGSAQQLRVRTGSDGRQTGGYDTRSGGAMTGHGQQTGQAQSGSQQQTYQYVRVQTPGNPDDAMSGSQLQHGRHSSSSHSLATASSTHVARHNASSGQFSGMGLEESMSGCSPCNVDGKTYRSGAKFDWRRGCIVYKCSCLCSGSHRCHFSVDPDCRQEEAHQGTGGIPVGPASSGRPARQPGGGCGNCYVERLVYPGNMSFTLRQGCNELNCRCFCDGKHECDAQRPVQGCLAMSTPLGGAQYTHSGAQAVYPLGGGAYAVKPGRVAGSFQQTYYASGSHAAGGGGAGGMMYVSSSSLLPGQETGQGQLPHHHQQTPHRTQSTQPQPGYPTGRQVPYPQDGKTRVSLLPLEPVETSAAEREGAALGRKCAFCFVNGRANRGSFHYTRDCLQVTCYCDCSGWLRCSVQPALTPDCPPQLGPVTGDCRTCLVHGLQYPPDLQFALRVGCYGYKCSCGCDGAWSCPTQQPTNYCVRPAPQPDSDPTAPRGLGGTAELKDPAAVSRDETPGDERMLSCLDCDVRGTVYPSRTRFFLKDGCRQFTCDCACDGSWSCPKDSEVDVCREEKEREEEDGQDRQDDEQEEAGSVEGGEGKEAEGGSVLEEEEGGEEGASLQQRGRQLAEVAAGQARRDADTAGRCRGCQVGDQHFLTNTDFRLRQGCHLRTCRCFCNGSYACPTAVAATNLCRHQGSDGDAGGGRVEPNGCSQCRMGDKTFPGGRAFSYTEGCWEFGCRCGCNGVADCPAASSRDLCNAAGHGQGSSPNALVAPGNGAGEGMESGASESCKPCIAGGKVIRSRTAFTKRRGCTEFLCTCNCNGSWACPPDRSLDLCDQQTSDSPAPGGPGSTPRKGCTVGRRTYFSRLFAFTDGCVQHMCICYDSGAWRCPPAKQQRIC